MKRENKRKSTFLEIVVLLIILLLMATIALYSSYAKYTTTSTSTGSDVVAKWDFSTSIFGNASSTSTFNLYDTMTTKPATTKLSANRVAPGTSGTFAIALTSNSEVGTNYTITITPKSGTLPKYLTFTSDTGTITASSGALTITGTINAGVNETKTVNVSWAWPYDNSDDAQDTTDGETADSYTFEVAITGTQVNPA